MPLKRIRTVTAIEWTVVTATAIGALYALMRFFISGYTVADSGLLPVLDTTGAGLLWTTFLLIGSVLVTFGLIKKRAVWKKRGWFILATCRMLQVIGHIVILGPIPLVWIYPATIMVIMTILYLHANLTVDRPSLQE